MTHRRLAPWLLRVVEIVCLTAGVMALGWYAAAHVAAARDQADGARELRALAATVEGAVAAMPPAVREEAAVARTPLATGALVGRIEVPRIGLSAVVREGADDRTLKRAVGRVPETAMPGERGNVALAGHRDTFFRPLRHVRLGDRVVVTTPGGRYEYVVQETRVVPPTEVSVLDPTPEGTLTLITCYPFTFVGSAPDRFIVRAALVH